MNMTQWIARTGLLICTSLSPVALSAGSTPDALKSEPIGRLGAANNPGWIVEGDYLHMTLRHPSLEYGITDIGGVQDRGAVGSIIKIDPDYKSGFRVKAGRRIGGERDAPEFVIAYTRTDAYMEAHNAHIVNDLGMDGFFAKLEVEF